MDVVTTIAALRARLAAAGPVALVPTMGNLHDGHLALVARAEARGATVVTSIFVNRLQFAPHEDFDTYPRTFERDCAQLEAGGCDIVFAPAERELYPEPQTFTVHPAAELADVLEGHFRPGFFTGVCTVVMKLFGCVQPTSAYFGKKDYQQLLVIRRMVEQFALPIEIVPCETSRADDGLALSSRNGYLSAAERARAVQLSQALRRGAASMLQATAAGHDEREAIESATMASLADSGWAPDYVAIRRRSDLGLPAAEDPMVVLAAARLGSTRLIDNLEIDPRQLDRR